MRSGAVKSGEGVVRIEPIEGPGACGIDFPLKVTALDAGPGQAMSFADGLQPPATIPNVPAAEQPHWSASPPRSWPLPPPSAADIEAAAPLAIHPTDAADPDTARESELNLQAPSITPAHPLYRPPEDVAFPTSPRPTAPLSPPRAQPVTTAVAVNPPATLACPIVSVLDKWIAQTVQPAALRWFGQRVVAIHQISAYSCRGMNGNPHAHISEHAFGNALDIAGFTLADGRRITVKDGWHGSPQEQGFLHDVQGGACDDFATVLSPGYNIYHYNHIHVDLMRRSHSVCRPAAIPGEVAAARAARSEHYAHQWGPGVTGSIRSSTSNDDDAVSPDDENEGGWTGHGGLPDSVNE